MPSRAFAAFHAPPFRAAMRRHRSRLPVCAMHPDFGNFLETEVRDALAFRGTEGRPSEALPSSAARIRSRRR